MKHSIKNLYIGIAIFASSLLFSCQSNSGMNEKKIQDSLRQDSLRQDSLRQDSMQNETEDPVDELLQEDSLSENNRGLRTP